MILDNLQDDMDNARIRNMALSQILMDMESNKMRYPFNQRPSCRSYAELIEWFKSMLSQNASLEIEDDDQVYFAVYSNIFYMQPSIWR